MDDLTLLGTYPTPQRPDIKQGDTVTVCVPGTPDRCFIVSDVEQDRDGFTTHLTVIPDPDNI